MSIREGHTPGCGAGASLPCPCGNPHAYSSGLGDVGVLGVDGAVEGFQILKQCSAAGVPVQALMKPASFDSFGPPHATYLLLIIACWK